MELGCSEFDVLTFYKTRLNFSKIMLTQDQRSSGNKLRHNFFDFNFGVGNNPCLPMGFSDVMMEAHYDTAMEVLNCLSNEAPPAPVGPTFKLRPSS